MSSNTTHSSLKEINLAFPIANQLTTDQTQKPLKRRFHLVVDVQLAHLGLHPFPLLLLQLLRVFLLLVSLCNTANGHVENKDHVVSKTAMCVIEQSRPSISVLGAPPLCIQQSYPATNVATTREVSTASHTRTFSNVSRYAKWSQIIGRKESFQVPSAVHMPSEFPHKHGRSRTTKGCDKHSRLQVSAAVSPVESSQYPCSQ